MLTYLRKVILFKLENICQNLLKMKWKLNAYSFKITSKKYSN